jgi:thioredoxin 1
MNDTEEQKSDGASGSCCGSKTKWIWVALALALGVIMFGKLANKGPSANCSGGICTLPTTTTTSNTGPAIAGAPGATVVAPPAAANLPRLVDLGAGKCIPCKLMAPILEDLKNTYAGKLDVQFIDVWVNPDEGTKYGIKMIPTQIFYNAAGKELFRHEGFFAREDILAKWQEFGVDLAGAAAVPGGGR